MIIAQITNSPYLRCDVNEAKKHQNEVEIHQYLEYLQR